jgi:hypothetical protein
MRLFMQAFSGLYVLSFATLLSITTGYRAQLSGYYGYHTDKPSQLQPVGELSLPSMVVYNGSRVGRSDSPIYALEQVSLPVEGLNVASQTYKMTDLIDNSQHFEEPYGVFFDCKSCNLAIAACMRVTQTHPLASDRLLHLSRNPRLGDFRTARKYDSIHVAMCLARLLLYRPRRLSPGPQWDYAFVLQA